MTRTRLTFALLASTALAGPASGQAMLPTAPSVAAGGVAISTPNGSTMNIQQSTGTAIVNWQGFSVGQGASVNISQPSAQSALLNRVTGQTPSTIAGQINANGQVFLVNPNGIAITRTGVVNAGAFVASTLNTSDQDFLAGKRVFTGGGSSAAVINEGTITIGSGGYAALIGGRVENSGTISVPLGQVGLGAGEQVTLDLSGDGFLQVGVPSTGQPTDKALIENSGRIRANGGRVEIKAASLREAARNVINVSGLVEARTVSGRNGAIVLGGGEGGTVTVSGRLDASGGRRALAQGRPSTAKGGEITVTGDRIRLAGARIDASGAAGGGSVRIGGDYQGGGNLQRASTTAADGATTIRADALKSGDGGRVILWSDNLTTFQGLISARGGPDGGNGGFAEVSGKAVLAYAGTTDLSAPNGAFGTLLLDPYNVTNSNNSDTQTGFTATGNDSNINVTTLTNALATANVTVSTGTGGSQAGNITVADPIGWSSSSSLTLQAAGAIAINAAVTAPNGALTLTAGSAASPITAVAAVNVGTFLLNRGSWAQVAASLPEFNAQNFILSPFGLGTGGSFLRAQGGAGTIGNPYLIADVYGLQGIAGSASYALAGNIDATRAAAWSGGAGFAPISTFAGSLDGRGLTVNGLSISRPSTTNVGLFASLSGAVRNLQLANVNITGGSQTGALAGSSSGSVTGTSVAGTVRGIGSVGGLVGLNTGTISGAAANVAVSGSQDNVGGLVGQSNGGGTITGSTASGPVSGRSFVGGLAGASSDPISGSSASGAVSGTAGSVGGLVGSLGGGGTIDQSSATGAVTGATSVGGLIGTNASTTIIQSPDGSGVRNTFATGRVSGTTNVGGLIGLNQSSSSVSRSYATGDVSGTTSVGGLIGAATAPGPAGGQGIGDTFATGAVDGVTNVGGLIGQQNNVLIVTSYAIGRVSGQNAVGGLSGAGAGRASDSYWDTQRTGQATSAGTGAVGLTTAQLQAGLPPGFSGNVWTSGINGAPSYPYLLGTGLPPVIDATANRSTPVPTNPTETTNPVTVDPTQPTPPVQPPLPVQPAEPGQPILPIAPVVIGQPRPVLVSEVATLQPTLARQFTRAVPPAGRTDAVIEVSLGGGPISGLAGTRAEAGPGERGSARATLDFLRRSSRDLEQRLARCESEAGQGSYRACVADALGGYADAIETRSLTLPEPLRNVAAVIRQAAAGVRAAPSLAAARAIVQAAIVEVREAIALIRAEDRTVGRLQTGQGNVIASALASVDGRLARAVGL